MFKNKLNNYFILDCLKSYLFVLSSLSMLIWITQSARFLYLVTDTGLSVSVYGKYIIYLIPKIVSQVMLISFLISVFLTIIKFQKNKEIEIYWLAGVSKKDIVKILIKISFVPTIFGLFFYIYLAPFTSMQSRQILSNSEFSLVNTLVKKNNFNSPLKGLTIFVKENDNQGNLEKVFIFENSKTIISKKGRVVSINNKNFIELSDGIIHEKNLKNNIEVVKFKTTMFDFTKYQTNITRHPKMQELSFLKIIKEYISSSSNKLAKNNLLHEIHKRIFKPLFIPMIAILSCFILYSNNEKISLNKIKIITFSIGILFIIFIEILLDLSAGNIFFKYFLYGFPIFGAVTAFVGLNNFLKNEAKAE
jgi:lipopolysaccharide export system permease protein